MMKDLSGVTSRRNLRSTRGLAYELTKLSKTTTRHRFLFTKMLRRISNRKAIVGSLLVFLLIIFYISYGFLSPHIHKVKTYDEYIKHHMLPIGEATSEDYYITRPNGRDDGGIVRVMFAMYSTHVDWTLCYALASAYFTNIPIVVIGYKTHKYHHVWRHEHWVKAALNAGFENQDVVLKIDADIMFTGSDFLPFIDKFIKLSPASLTELDAKAIRTDEALAPIISGSEWGCWSYQTYGATHRDCKLAYMEAELKHILYEQSLNSSTKPLFDYYDNEIKYDNGGTSIQRMWAMYYMNAAISKMVETESTAQNDNEWNCDQSVVTKLYLSLRLWEVENDYFRKSKAELLSLTNEYGMYAGLYSLDLKNEFSSNLWEVQIKDFVLTNEKWQSENGNSTTTTMLTSHPYSPHISTFIRKVYDNANKQELFKQQKLTRSYSNVHSVTIAPPLLSVIPRHINGRDKPAERVYPWLTHYSGLEKEPREAIALNYMQWYLPMMFNEEEWKRGKQYVMSMPIELWTDKNDKLRLRYGDVCEKHPFNRMQFPQLTEYEVYKDKPFW